MKQTLVSNLVKLTSYTSIIFFVCFSDIFFSFSAQQVHLCIFLVLFTFLTIKFEKDGHGM